MAADIEVFITSGHIIVADMNRGLSGFSGRSGYSGFSGANPGASGYSGFSGKSGFSGRSGYSGYSGTVTVGSSGFSGRSGYSGFSGPSGYSGFSGANPGASGYSGFSGPSGYSGFTGVSGFSGFSGYSGFSGRSGFSGYSGYSGISGYSGFSSTSGYSGFSGAFGFLRYVALLTQTSTNAPVATVLANTLGGTVVWTRDSAGLYTGTLAAAFTVNKTLALISNGDIGGGGAFVLNSAYATANTIKVSSLDPSSGSPTDGVITAASLEVRVYP